MDSQGMNANTLHFICRVFSLYVITITLFAFKMMYLTSQCLYPYGEAQTIEHQHEHTVFLCLQLKIFNIFVHFLLPHHLKNYCYYFSINPQTELKDYPAILRVAYGQHDESYCRCQLSTAGLSLKISEVVFNVLVGKVSDLWTGTARSRREPNHESKSLANHRSLVFCQKSLNQVQGMCWRHQLPVENSHHLHCTASRRQWRTSLQYSLVIV